MPTRASSLIASRWAVPLLMATLTAIVTGWQYWVPGMWVDEVATVVSIERPWLDLLRELRNLDAVHGVYYVLMKAWASVFGFTPASLRLPSVLAVAATSALLVVIGRRQWNLTTGIVAAAALTAIPRTMWLAVEARSYAMAALLVTLIVYLTLASLARGRWWQWLALAAVVGFASTVFIFSLLVLPAIGLAVLVQRPGWRTVLAAAASLALGVIAAAPVVWLALRQRGQIGWISLTTRQDVIDLPAQAVFRPDSWMAWLVIIGAVLILGAVGSALGWGTPARVMRPWAMAVLCLGWVLIPTALLLIGGRIVPLYTPRYLSPILPGVALCLALGFAGFTGSGIRLRRVVAGVLVAMFIVLANLDWAFYRQPDSKDVVWHVVHEVERLRRPGDQIWFGASGFGRIAKYAYPDAFVGLPDLGDGNDKEALATLWDQQIPLSELQSSLQQVNRLLVVVYTPEGGGPDRTQFEPLIAAGLTAASTTVDGPWTTAVYERVR